MAHRSQNIKEKKIRVGANIRMYEEKPSGIQNFIQGLFTNLIETNPHCQFIFFSTGKKKIEKSAIHIDNKSVILQMINKINPLVTNIFFDNIYVLKNIYQSSVDVFIGTSYIIPLLRIKKTKSITIIYDLSYLNYIHNPYKLYLNLVLYMKFIVPKILKKTDAIIVTSEYVKKHIQKEYKTNPRKIHVVFAGGDEFFYQEKNSKLIIDVKKKFNISKKYCFTTATNHERKNIFGLISAFKEIKKSKNLQLIITGLLPEKTIHELKSHVQALHLDGRVKFLGFVTKEELRTLYSGAEIFVFPSFEEGFGFPVIEAALCGSLPICSNTGSLPEVIGNKNLMFNPLKTESITDKMNEVLSYSPNRYKKELQVVRDHIKKFTWQKTAEKFSAVISNVANL